MVGADVRAPLSKSLWASDRFAARTTTLREIRALNIWFGPVFGLLSSLERVRTNSQTALLRMALGIGTPVQPVN